MLKESLLKAVILNKSTLLPIYMLLLVLCKIANG